MSRVSQRSPNEMCQDADIEKLLLFPVNRLLVRKPLCCLPELGDGRLITKVVTDMWRFCELNIIREPTCLMTQDPRVGPTLK